MIVLWRERKKWQSKANCSDTAAASLFVLKRFTIFPLFSTIFTHFSVFLHKGNNNSTNDVLFIYLFIIYLSSFSCHFTVIGLLTFSQYSPHLVFNRKLKSNIFTEEMTRLFLPLSFQSFFWFLGKIREKTPQTFLKYSVENKWQFEVKLCFIKKCARFFTKMRFKF